MKYNPIISFIKTPKEVIKEYLHRSPQPGFDWRFLPSSTSEDMVNSHLNQLRQDGISILPGYFKGETLARLQAAFERVLRERPQDPMNPNAAACFDYMDLDPVFLEAATDSALLEIIARYYRRRFALGRADAFRSEPLASQRYGSYQWHHDSRGKQVKIQVLLTDLKADGQRMTYIKGSHTRYYSYYRSRGHGSRFEAEYAECRENPDVAASVIDVIGPAGTAILFDTNGLHSGNRNETARRDTLTFYYPTPISRNCRRIRYRQADFQRLDDTKRRMVQFNPLHELID